MDYSADQLAAIHGLQDFITQPFEPVDCERVLTGSAGTGKTSVVKALVESDPGPIILSALTHQAASVPADITKRDVRTSPSICYQLPISLEINPIRPLMEGFESECPNGRASHATE